MHTVCLKPQGLSGKPWPDSLGPQSAVKASLVSFSSRLAFGKVMFIITKTHDYLFMQVKSH